VGNNIIFSQGSGLNDSMFGKCQAPIRMFLEQRAEAFMQLSMLKELFLMGTSASFGETLTSLTAMEGFEPVGENGSHPLTGMQEGYKKTLEYPPWKRAFMVSREMIDDGRLMDFKKRPEGFITAFYRTRERFGAALYAGAINGAKTVKFGGTEFDISAADGQPLFSKTHPGKVSKKTQSNLFADAFSAEALGRMESRMQNLRGDNDEVLAVSPDTILIPNDADLKNAVFAAIGADKDPNTANNAYNYQYGRWTVIVWSYLNEWLAAGVKPWVMLDSTYNQTNGGAVWTDRVKLEVNSSIDEDTNANVWRGYARFNATFNDFRFAAVGGVTGGDALSA
jgi:hypothetical protein